MFKKLAIPDENLKKGLEEEVNNFLKEIEDLKNNKIEKICKENLITPNLNNFLKLFPENYLKVVKTTFEEYKGKLNMSLYLQKKIKDANLPYLVREKSKDLEEYFLFDFVGKRIDFLISSIENYYFGRTEKIELSFFFDKISGLYGDKLIFSKINDLLERIYYIITSNQIYNIYKKFEKNLEENFYKVREKFEFPPLLILQMAINSLNLRYPNLFKNLNPENEKLLKNEFLKMKKRGLILSYLYSFTKYFLDEGLVGEDPEEYLNKLNNEKINEIMEKFSMGMELENPLKIEDLGIIKKSYIFKRIIIDKDFKILEVAERDFEDDEIFLKICKEKLKEEYETFVKEEMLPFINQNKEFIPFLRNLLFSPSFFSHNEILVFNKFKENFFPFLEKDEIKKPFEGFEEKNVLSIKNKIYQLKQDFSKIELEEFKIRCIKIFEEISATILFWDDYEILLEEFSKEFLHLPQIPIETGENFKRLVLSYLSYLLNEAVFLDLPEGAKPQITLFETLNEAKEKGKLLSLSSFLKKPISYLRWEEALFELKLSTPYRDFYNYIKGFIPSKDSLFLLREVLEVLQKEDFDLSISQRIFQDMSFLSDIKENDIFNMLLDLENFHLFKNELKERIFKIYPNLKKELKDIIKTKGLFTKELEIEITRKERSFLKFLEEMSLSKAFTSFDEYLKISKSPYKKEESGFGEEFFIPIKHYLIQIEPVKGGFFITLNVSGKKEGPHPFEGQRLKTYMANDPKEVSWALFLFQKYASFLLDLEEELFVYEYILPKKFQKYKIKKGKDEKVIYFKKSNGKYQLKISFEKTLLKKIWAKAFGPFYATSEDEIETEKDIRLLLSLLKNVLL